MYSYYAAYEVSDLYPARKVCALCDAGFKTTPAKQGFKVEAIDGEPVDSATYIKLSPAFAQQIEDILNK